MSYIIKFGQQHIMDYDPELTGIFFRICQDKGSAHKFNSQAHAIRIAQALGAWDIGYEHGNYSKTFVISVLDQSTGECVYKHRGLKSLMPENIFTQDW